MGLGFLAAVEPATSFALPKEHGTWKLCEWNLVQLNDKEPKNLFWNCSDAHSGTFGNAPMPRQAWWTIGLTTSVTKGKMPLRSLQQVTPWHRFLSLLNMAG
jgi:hypothetical protein